MQDRYAGDIGDYGKMALLRALCEEGLKVGVNWYKVDPLDAEKNEDGTYKQNDGKHFIPENLRKCDTVLADALLTISKSDRRSIEALENADLIPDAVYYSEPVTMENREYWHRKALEQLNGADIVFLDPDNGLLVKSVGKKSARSIKYAFYEEVRDYVDNGKSVLVYNHRCRKKEEIYFHEICCKLRKCSLIPEDSILKITFPKRSVRDYFAIPVSEEHAVKIRSAFSDMAFGIWGELGVCRLPEQ